MTQKEVLFEIGTRLGREHIHDRTRFRLHWEEHVQRSREIIARAAGRAGTPDHATVLGGGASYNIPLDELARRFGVVRLVDIDRDGLQQAVDSLPADLRAKMEIHVADVTGGVAARLLGMGLEIIESSSAPDEAQSRLIPLFRGDNLDMTPDPSLAAAWRASLVVSSGLSSQMTIFPEKAAGEAFRNKFGTDLDEDFFLKNGSSSLRNEWVRRHGEFLASLLSEDGRVYWADTVAETPYLQEFGAGPLDAIVGAVADFLKTAYLKTFLNERGKQVLAERIAEAAPFSLAKDDEGRHRQGEQFLQFFNDRLDPQQKRIMAWAVMTMVGEDLISPRKELELVGFIIREAERMSPQARQPILDGPLSGFFPPSLETDGRPASWLWINDPEGAVTLSGYSYYVEAHILKRRGLQ